MAERDFAVVKLSANREVLVTWTGLANGDTGQAFDRAAFADRAVQFTGTFGVAGGAVLEGSLDGSTWFTLNDPFNAALSFTTAGLRQVLEHVVYVRPRVTGGDGTTDLACRLLVKG